MREDSWIRQFSEIQCVYVRMLTHMCPEKERKKRGKMLAIIESRWKIKESLLCFHHSCMFKNFTIKRWEKKKKLCKLICITWAFPVKLFYYTISVVLWPFFTKCNMDISPYQSTYVYSIICKSSPLYGFALTF